jgi:sugar porter (SP) family MFS transporter
VSAFQLALAVGVLFSYVMAYFLSDEGTWHTLFVIGAGLALVQFLLLIFIPETPTWCISHEKQAQAVKALKKIRRDSLWESTLHLIPKISKEKMQWVDFTPPVRRVLIIGCILSVFQQITGINAIIYYTPKIFQFVGITADNSFLATLAIGCVNLLATLFALCLLDKLGRRILLFVGIIGMILGLGVLSFGFFVESPLIDTLSLVSLMLYVACFSLSLGPVTWVILSEIFPLKVRGNALAIALCLNWLANYVISLTFPNLIAELGGGMAFGFFGIVSCLAFIFVCFFIPETKGKSLEQIETMVKSGKFK